MASERIKAHNAIFPKLTREHLSRELWGKNGYTLDALHDGDHPHAPALALIPSSGLTGSQAVPSLAAGIASIRRGSSRRNLWMKHYIYQYDKRHISLRYPKGISPFILVLIPGLLRWGV